MPIGGFEVTHALRERRERAFLVRDGIVEEVRRVERAFRTRVDAFTEAAQLPDGDLEALLA